MIVTQRARWTACGLTWPELGCTGIVWQANGHYDPESIEYKAWLFEPDGDEGAVFCERSDFEIIKETSNAN